MAAKKQQPEEPQFPSLTHAEAAAKVINDLTEEADWDVLMDRVDGLVTAGGGKASPSKADAELDRLANAAQELGLVEIVWRLRPLKKPE